MKIKRLCIFIAAFIFFAISLFTGVSAQNGSEALYVVTLYNESNGLPTGEANEVLQTSDGYIWIGSYGGLIRYDGTSFRNFSLGGEIASSSIRGLFEDSAGRLWIGTNDAGVFVMENGVISPVPREDETSFVCVRDFAEGPDGTVYVASNSGMAEIVDGVLKPISGEHTLGQVVYSVDVDSRGRVWGALNAGVVALAKDGREICAYTSPDFFDAESIYCTGSDDKGNIFLGTSASVLVKLGFTSDSLDPEDFGKEYIDTPGVTTHNSIRTARDGDVVVCGNIGSCVLKPDGSQICFTESQNAASVNGACIDYENNIWLASTSHGIIKYTLGCFESPNSESGLEGISLNAVVKQGGFFFAATDSGILAFDENWNPVENALTELYVGVRVRSLAADSRGDVWAATYADSGSAACFNPATGELKTFDPSNGLLSTGARTVGELSDGSIAIGTKEGLNIVRDGEVVESYGVNEGLTTTSVLCTAEGRDGSILVGSDGGGIYEIKDGKVACHGASEGLSEGVVLRILEDGDGSGYFISAGSSLYYWDDAGFRKLEINKLAGSIFDFTLKYGKLWIMQNDGILSFDRQKLLDGESPLAKEYSFSHGLTGSLNANTWNWIDPESGKIYLATRNGVSIFGFESVAGELPLGIINSVWVDGEEFKSPTEIELKTDANRLTIDFSALTFTDTTSFGMSYSLEGFDKEVSTVIGVKNDSVSYTNLPGGEYAFNLKIFDPDSPDSARLYSLKITKDKKLYEYPLFIVGAVLIFAAAGAGIIILCARAKIKRMQKSQREYRNIIQQSLQTFARAIDAKDRYTNGHSLRVAEYSAELAKRLGLSASEQERVYYIALLHDIGKIGIPDSILNKPGKLTDEERRIIQNHPLIGGEILKDFTAIEGIADGAKYHHERIDGNGYNEHRKGDEIPLIARIIGVADTYDAMSSTRCYRPALTEEFIIEELKRVSGTQLDPNIVPHLLDMIAEGKAPLAEDAHKEAKAIGSLYMTESRSGEQTE